MKRRAPVIPVSSLADVVAAALARCSHIVDVEEDRAEIASVVVAALLARPEAVALQIAWGGSPTQCALLTTQRELLGDREGELLAAAARLAGLAVTS